MENKPQITFDEFLAIEAKLEIKIGRITAIERVPKSKKLLKLTVDFRYDSTETKTVVTNIGDKFNPEELLGVKMPFITNLVPTTIMGITSEAMRVVGQSYGENVIFEIQDYSIGTRLL